MADARTLRIEFKGEGSESLVAQYDAVITKQKELEKELTKTGQAGGKGAEQFDEMGESLTGLASSSTIAAAAGRGLALGLGALGGALANLAIEGVSWAIDKLSDSSNKGEEYLARFKGQADQLATSLLSVESAAGLAITRLNEYNLLRANDGLRAAITLNQEKIRGQDSEIFGFKPISYRRENADVADLLRRAGNDKDLDLEGIKAYRAELERIGQRSEELRDELEPTRLLFTEIEAAIAATTPTIVTHEEVTGKLNAAYKRSVELLGMEADAAAIARAGDAAYAKGRAEAARQTGISADEVERLAQQERARGEELARLQIAQREANKAVEGGTKGKKDHTDATTRLTEAEREELRVLKEIERQYEREIDLMMDRDAIAAQRASDVSLYIKSLEDEARLLGLSNDERERELRLADAKRANGGDDLTPEQRAAVLAAGAELDAAKAAKQAADEVAQIWDRMREDERAGWSDFWYGVFNDGKFRFGGLVDSFRSAWARGMADMLASSQQGLFAPLIGGIASLFGGSVSGGTGAAGTRNVFSSMNWFGGSGSSMSMGSLADIGDGSGLRVANASSSSGFGGGFGDMLSSGAGGIAASLGSLLSSINGRGGKITSTLGGLGGQIGSMFGPLGALIGGGAGIGLGSTIQGVKNGSLNWLGAITEIFPSFLPFGEILAPLSLLGVNPFGLFGHTPLSSARFTGGGVSGSDGFGGLKPKVAEDMVDGLLEQLAAFADAIGGGLDEDVFGGVIGQRGKKYFYQPQDSKLGKAGKKKFGAVKFKTAEEAIAAAVEAALENGIVQGLTDADRRLLDAADSVSEGMQKVIASHDFKKELAFAYQGLTDPLGEQLARLQDWYAEQLKLAEEYEADKTQLEAVYNARRKELIESYNEQLYGGLKDFLTSITGGSASPLSPTSRLNLAQARYTELSAKARGGDESAIGSLQGAAQDYLSAGRDVFASSDGFFSIYNRVVGDISGITGMANPLGVGSPANQNVAAAVNDNSRMQQAAALQASQQRNTTNQLLADVKALLAPVAATLGRGVAMPTQNGTVQVGAVDWAAIQAAVGSIR